MTHRTVAGTKAARQGMAQTSRGGALPYADDPEVCRHNAAVDAKKRARHERRIEKAIAAKKEKSC